MIHKPDSVENIFKCKYSSDKVEPGWALDSYKMNKQGLNQQHEKSAQMTITGKKYP